MSVVERLHMRSFEAAIGWISTEPFSPAEPRRHVVLLDFWLDV